MRPVHRQVAFGDVQIGAAHPARRHGDLNFVRAGFSGQGIDELEGVVTERARRRDTPRRHHLCAHEPIVDHRRGLGNPEVGTPAFQGL